MKFIVYSGSYSINSLGATKSLCSELVRHIDRLGYDIVWVGRGEFENSGSVICLSLSKSRVGEFLIRIKNKLLRTFFRMSPNDISINEFLTYDLEVSKLISRGIIKVDEKTCFIGLGGMSQFSFLEVHKKKGRTVLASQFLHPHSHNALLEKEYLKIGAINPIPPARIERQLKEVEIVDLVWVFSKLAEESFLENGTDQSRLINSPLGVDFKLYDEYPRTRSINDEKFRILFVGNVNPEKGIHVLLEALLFVNTFGREIELILNGNVAPYFRDTFATYKKKLMDIGIQVFVEPGVPTDNYMKSDLFVLPSTHDSFGLVVLEAMASGLPVILSSKVGALDCILDGENGFVFEESSADDLRKHIEIFLKDKKSLKTFGERSVGLAKGYEWNKSIKNLLEKIIQRLSVESP